MKAEININGVLTVKAENGCEAYALDKWRDDFSPGSEEEGESVLVISTGGES